MSNVNRLIKITTTILATISAMFALIYSMVK